MSALSCEPAADLDDAMLPAKEWKLLLGRGLRVCLSLLTFSYRFVGCDPVSTP